MVRFSTVAANPTTFTRVGMLTIGGRGFTVTQTGNTCTTTLSSSGVSVGAAPSTVPVTVSTSGECTWTASSGVPWISVTSGANGTGPGTVALSIAQNTGSSVRSAVVSVAGKSFSVNQFGSCDYAVSPATVTVAGGSASANAWVTVGAGCAWTVSNSASWIKLSTAGGSGTGVVGLVVAPNPTTSPRTATLTIADSSVVVNQAGAACNYSVTPVSMNVTGGDRSIAITAPTGCTLDRQFQRALDHFQWQRLRKRQRHAEHSPRME